MKIVSSALGMDASTGYTDVTKTGVKLTAGSISQSGVDGFNLQLPEWNSGISKVEVNRQKNGIESVSVVQGTEEQKVHTQSQEQVVENLVTEVIGGRVTVRELNGNGPLSELPQNRDTATGRNVVAGLEGGLTRISLGLERVEYSREALEVRTAGTVVTEDGREIAMRMQLNIENEEVSRESFWAERISSRFIDPLVLSFDDGLAVLDDSEFCFDLNCDGVTEEISRLKSGSGFLVFDQNGDGTVNDGNELFGPRTGAGYEELHIYDEDGNNWIDEGDPIFDKLQLWMGAGQDDAVLVSLRDAGVGALSLASIDAHFNLKDNGGRVIGQVSQAGLFITEDGNVRPMSEVDLAVKDDELPDEQSGFSSIVQGVLSDLREIISERRRRMTRLAELQLRNDDVEKREDWLLRRLWELREEEPFQRKS
ncbi:hypothetical protein [Desulfosediminicola flagellatus]|uniref:hypothetical protein n=1 Tax=Desulfosediminicola flagellatus TaxID=2569541 RepID=UPI0010ACEFD0|nr:hypothetical protein [Desulfosediminicola flagellatus]